MARSHFVCDRVNTGGGAGGLLEGWGLGALILLQMGTLQPRVSVIVLLQLLVLGFLRLLIVDAAIVDAGVVDVGVF